MNVILSTSRGKAIEPFFGSIAKEHKLKYIFSVHCGAKLAYLNSHINNFLSNRTETENKETTVYVIAGLPDITTMIRDKRNSYEEVILQGDPEEIKERVIRELYRTSDIIQSYQSKAVFATIVPSNIEKWNTVKLSKCD